MWNSFLRRRDPDGLATQPRNSARRRTPMSDAHATGHWRSLTAVAVATLLLGGFASAHAALTTEACLAKKLKEWGKLRNCQAKENAKALQGKDADQAKCQTKFEEKLAKVTAKATEAGIACRYGV